MRRIVCLILFLILCSACAEQGAGDPLTELTFSGRTMGTTYTVKLVPQDKVIEQLQLQAKLDATLLKINQVMSTYIPESELSMLNASKSGEWQPASAMLMTVLRKSLDIYTLSDGAFEPSIGPLVNLWGFGPNHEVKFPEPPAIQSAMRNIGYNRVSLDVARQLIRKPENMYIDLSAIAKGYAVDQLALLLNEQGVKHYLVEVGGELRASGLNAEQKVWRIAIEKPEAGIRQVYGVLDVSDKGMATSGGYRNFFEKDGRRYSHTIDPKTGYPVTHSLLSVTVLAADAMTADALATAFMVMGAEAGYSLAAQENIAAWFIELSDEKLVDKLTPKMQTYRVH